MTTNISSVKRFKYTLVSLLDVFEEFSVKYSQFLITFKPRHLNILRLYTDTEEPHDLLKLFLNKSINHWSEFKRCNIQYFINNIDVMVDRKYRKYIYPIIELLKTDHIEKSYINSIFDHIHALVRICIHYMYNNIMQLTIEMNMHNIKNLGKRWNTKLNYTPHTEILDEDSSSDESSSEESSSSSDKFNSEENEY